MAYTLLSPTGQKLRAKTSRQMSALTGLDPGHIRGLKCGNRLSLRGFVSMHRRATAKRKRLLTRLRNVVTSEESILGPSALKWAREKGLSPAALSELLNGKVVCYRNWVLSLTYEAAHGVSPESIF